MKPALRAKFGVKDEWVLPFEVIPIINIPEFGDKSAEKVCVDLNIKSQNDKDKLAEAKRLTYLRGFTEGTMLVGEFKDKKVQEAKPLIKNILLQTGQAVMYSEPEKKVMSRSGDECIVALTDQWYITYGKDEWKAKAEECSTGMELYYDESRHGFEHTLSWLTQWACSRSFGLGTRLPWDEQFLVESLSDSTLYMAYYAIAHLLQNGDMYGRAASSVKPDQMTDEVWDYIFCGDVLPQSSAVSGSLLEKMKQEFEYWYPFDLRVSGKDLIQNLLLFASTTILFPVKFWPRSFRCNGHIMLNSEKMSKSTGNFRTLRQAREEFSADATKFALADAGDGMDGANFVFEIANAAILRNYKSMLFREALKTGFYDLQAARDEYKLSCSSGGINRNLLWRFMDVQARMIAPISPHYAEHVWNSTSEVDSLLQEMVLLSPGNPVNHIFDRVRVQGISYRTEAVMP